MDNFNRSNYIANRKGLKRSVPKGVEPSKRTDLVPDWTNRNTITGEIIFDMARTRKGTYADPEMIMHEEINRKLTQ